MKLRQQRGRAGEDAAARHLAARGYRIVTRNWRAGTGMRGEVDCIAWHGEVLCFIEVKARTSSERGQPQEAVNFAKQRQLSRLANAYVSALRLGDTACRFDVVEVWLPPDGTAPRVALHQNAFDYRPPGRGPTGYGTAGGRGSRIF